MPSSMVSQSRSHGKSSLISAPTLKAPLIPSPSRRKLVIIGDGACGKTCLLISYTKRMFPQVITPSSIDPSSIGLCPDSL